MKFKGKIIGATIGLIIGGPIGMALGFIAGHLYDVGYFKAIIQATQGAVHTHAQQIFFNATFKVMGYIAKSDGHVSENEIHTARKIMSQMGLNETLKEQAIHLFNAGKQPDFHLDQTLFQLRQVFQMQPGLLTVFLDIQLQMASADGQLSATKNATLQNIREKLGVTGYQQYQNHTRSRTASMSLNDAYDILSVSPSANADEIKKAYRKLMSQNHPDKLIAKWLPPEMIKVATQKTQKIKEAYELIKKTKEF